MVSHDLSGVAWLVRHMRVAFDAGCLQHGCGRLRLTRPALSSLSMGRSGFEGALGRNRSEGLTNEGSAADSLSRCAVTCCWSAVVGGVECCAFAPALCSVDMTITTSYIASQNPGSRIPEAQLWRERVFVWSAYSTRIRRGCKMSEQDGPE